MSNNNTIQITSSVTIPSDGLELIAKAYGWKSKILQRNEATGQMEQMDNLMGFEDHIKASIAKQLAGAYAQAKARLAAQNALLDAADPVALISVT